MAQLADHLIAGNQMFATILGGAAAPPVEGRDRTVFGATEGDALTAYDRAADQLVRAFEADGALQRVVTVPFGTVPGSVALQLRITELLVHGWDLARATSQSMEVPDWLVQQTVTFSRTALSRVPAGRSPFAPPQPVPPGSPPLDQLAGLLGRAV